MLTHIVLENFKSWRKLDIDLAPLTILFGVNSSGKSSVLQALLLLKQTVASFDQSQHINFGGGERDYVDFGGWRDLVFGHIPNQELKFHLEWVSNTYIFSGKSFSYRIQWKQEDDRVITSLLEYATEIESEEILTVRGSPKKQGRYIYELSLGSSGKTSFSSHPPQNAYRLQGARPRISRPTGEDYIIDLGMFNIEFEMFIRRLNYLGPLRPYPQRYYSWRGTPPQAIGPRGENAIEMLIGAERQSIKTTNDRNLLLEATNWLVKMGLVDAFNLEATDRDQRFYQTWVEIGGIGSSLVDTGFGVSQVLPVIVLLLSVPEGSIVLLEQPELHLHPGAQAHLADLLLHVAETRRLQVIVESHSEHLLRRLQRRIAEVESAFATPENIKMYFCEKGSGGSTIRPVDVDIFGQILNWPENFFGDLTGDLEKMAKAALQRARNGR